MSDVLCPVCSADLPLDGDEDMGAVIICPCCSSPLKVTNILDNGDPVFIEDF